MPSKFARDLMIPLDQYPHIPYWFTLRQAVAEIEHSVLTIKGRVSLPRAVLVFDEPYQLVGIARRRDILRGLEPEFLRTMSLPKRKRLFDVEIDPNLVDLSTGKVANLIRERAELPISEVMQPIVDVVNFDDHLAKIIYRMVSKDQALIPVVKEEKIVGVVRSVDVFHEVANIIL